MTTEYSIIIPVYNGSPYLEILHQRLTRILDGISADYEIIMVDDHSMDSSWDIMCRLQKKDQRVKLLQLTKNFGQHNATLCGFKFCTGEYVLTMDDDLQHPPEEIPKLIAEMQKGYSVVYGKYQKKKHGWFRNLGSRLINKILTNITDNQFDLTSFRAVKGDLARSLQNFGSPAVILDLLFMHVISKQEISYCDIRHEESQTSHYNFLKLFKMALIILLQHTLLPLRVVTSLGILFSLLSFGLGFYYMSLYWLRHIDVSGFTTIVLLLTFFFGILLFVLGILGESIAAIFLALNKTPQYIVKRALITHETVPLNS